MIEFWHLVFPILVFSCNFDTVTTIELRERLIKNI